MSKLWESSKFAQKAAKKLTIKKKFSLNNLFERKKKKSSVHVIIELKQIQDKNRNNLKQTVNKNNPNILNKHANKCLKKFLKDTRILCFNDTLKRIIIYLEIFSFIRYILAN